MNKHYEPGDMTEDSYIFVKHHTEGDSRVTNGIPDFNDFSKANWDHCHDVQRAMTAIADMISHRADRHDWTKTRPELSQMFYEDLTGTVSGRLEDFTKGDWYKLHRKLERHHLDHQCCPEDVNLIDVIEMLCDQVCARAARCPENKFSILIDPQILASAVDNTIAMLDQIVIPLPYEEENK